MRTVPACASSFEIDPHRPQTISPSMRNISLWSNTSSFPRRHRLFRCPVLGWARQSPLLRTAIGWFNPNPWLVKFNVLPVKSCSTFRFLLVIPPNIDHFLGWNPQFLPVRIICSPIFPGETHFFPHFCRWTSTFSPFFGWWFFHLGWSHPGWESAGGTAESHGPETGPELSLAGCGTLQMATLGLVVACFQTDPYTRYRNPT